MKPTLVMMIPLGVLATVALPGIAKADEVAVRPYAVQERSETSGPNRTLLHSGLWTLGLSYVPAVIVAAGSDRDGDKNLYIPVAGPWMDLASRGSCPAGAACNSETVNKVLIVIDGIFQGLGALDIVGAFVFPETRTVTVSSSEHRDAVAAPSFRLMPAQVASGAYGLAAAGTF